MKSRASRHHKLHMTAATQNTTSLMWFAANKSKELHQCDEDINEIHMESTGGRLKATHKNEQHRRKSGRKAMKHIAFIGHMVSPGNFASKRQCCYFIYFREEVNQHL